MGATVVAFTACGGGGGGGTPTDTEVQSGGEITTDGTGGTNTGGGNNTPEEVFSITHNGTTYGVVKSPYTGKVWLDRNLGAARVCTSFNDNACYGDYYQWGRNFDGHQDSMSAITKIHATDINNAGSLFITDYASDWTKETVEKKIDYNGVKRSANWSKTDGSSVCPVGFRVPTLLEVKAEIVESSLSLRNNVSTTFLKMPFSGGRSGYTGEMDGLGTVLLVWTNSIGVAGRQSFYVSSGAATALATARNEGLPIRCITD